MKSKRNKTHGFTLIELMIVFLVIIILAGMVLRLMGRAGMSNSTAETRAILSRVAQALEEFRSTYGSYPPVAVYPDGIQPIEYEFPRKIASGAAGIIRTAAQNASGGYTDARVFTFGLVSFFVPRYTGHAENAPLDFIGAVNTGTDSSGRPIRTYRPSNAIDQWSNFYKQADGEEMGDPEKDIGSVRRIIPIFRGTADVNGRILSYGDIRETQYQYFVPGSTVDLYFTTKLTLMDAWGNPLCYESYPPYDSFKLWSPGPDGNRNTEGDNVYYGKE